MSERDETQSMGDQAQAEAKDLADQAIEALDGLARLGRQAPASVLRMIGTVSHKAGDVAEALADEIGGEELKSE